MEFKCRYRESGWGCVGVGVAKHAELQKKIKTVREHFVLEFYHASRNMVVG